MLKFEEKTLSVSLESLYPSFRAIFAVCCATRLFTAYNRFHENTGEGEPEVLRAALDFVWSNAHNAVSAKDEGEQFLKKVMRLIPEEDDSWTPDHAYADDAASAAAYALRTLLTEKAQEAAWSARRVYEALDHYVVNSKSLDVSVPSNEAVVLQDPMVQSELERQKRDYEELLKIDLASLPLVAVELKTRSYAEQAISRE